MSLFMLWFLSKLSMVVRWQRHCPQLDRLQRWKACDRQIATHGKRDRQIATRVTDRQNATPGMQDRQIATPDAKPLPPFPARQTATLDDDRIDRLQLLAEAVAFLFENRPSSPDPDGFRRSRRSRFGAPRARQDSTFCSLRHSRDARLKNFAPQDSPQDT